MSTEVLNRRMDLIHSFTNGVHYLTMDTSYPVKVDGLVLKLFVATSDYSDNATSDSKAFCIKTANNTNTIANITKDNVLNFKKKKLEDNAFKKNDYVMAIIDIYNQKLYLCSQTDFAKLKTEDDTPVGDFCKLKMFDITNDTETLDKLNEAINFQNLEESRFSFTRNSAETSYDKDGNKEHGDYTVYQLMNDNTQIPVADVETIQNNGISIFIHPYMHISSEGYGQPTYWEGINSATNRMQVFVCYYGYLSEKFIKDYCFSYNDEIYNLLIKEYDETQTKFNLFNQCGKYHSTSGLVNENSDLPVNKDDYYYFVMSEDPNNERAFYPGYGNILPVRKSDRLLSIIKIVDMPMLANDKKEFVYFDTFGENDKYSGSRYDNTNAYHNNFYFNENNELTYSKAGYNLKRLVGKSLPITPKMSNNNYYMNDLAVNFSVSDTEASQAYMYIPSYYTRVRFGNKYNVFNVSDNADFNFDTYRANTNEIDSHIRNQLYDLITDIRTNNVSGGIVKGSSYYNITSLKFNYKNRNDETVQLKSRFKGTTSPFNNDTLRDPYYIYDNKYINGSKHGKADTVYNSNSLFSFISSNSDITFRVYHPICIEYPLTFDKFNNSNDSYIANTIDLKYIASYLCYIPNSNNTSNRYRLVLELNSNATNSFCNIATGFNKITTNTVRPNDSNMEYDSSSNDVNYLTKSNNSTVTLYDFMNDKFFNTDSSITNSYLPVKSKDISYTMTKSSDLKMVYSSYNEGLIAGTSIVKCGYIRKDSTKNTTANTIRIVLKLNPVTSGKVDTSKNYIMSIYLDKKASSTPSTVLKFTDDNGKIVSDNSLSVEENFATRSFCLDKNGNFIDPIAKRLNLVLSTNDSVKLYFSNSNSITVRCDNSSIDIINSVTTENNKSIVSNYSSIDNFADSLCIVNYNDYYNLRYIVEPSNFSKLSYYNIDKDMSYYYDHSRVFSDLIFSTNKLNRNTPTIGKDYYDYISILKNTSCLDLFKTDPDMEDDYVIENILKPNRINKDMYYEDESSNSFRSIYDFYRKAIKYYLSMENSENGGLVIRNGNIVSNNFYMIPMNNINQLTDEYDENSKAQGIYTGKNGMEYGMIDRYCFKDQPLSLDIVSVRADTQVFTKRDESAITIIGDYIDTILSTIFVEKDKVTITEKDSKKAVLSINNVSLLEVFDPAAVNDSYTTSPYINILTTTNFRHMNDNNIIYSAIEFPYVARQESFLAFKLCDNVTFNRSTNGTTRFRLGNGNTIGVDIITFSLSYAGQSYDLSIYTISPSSEPMSLDSQSTYNGNFIINTSFLKSNGANVSNTCTYRDSSTGEYKTSRLEYDRYVLFLKKFPLYDSKIKPDSDSTYTFGYLDAKGELNLSNRFDSNNVYSNIYSYLSQYQDDSGINITKTQTGLREGMAISIVDKDGMLFTLNGTESKEVDEINWYDLLIALNHNQYLDILGQSIKYLKTQLPKSDNRRSLDMIANVYTSVSEVNNATNQDIRDVAADMKSPSTFKSLFTVGAGSTSGLYNLPSKITEDSEPYKGTVYITIEKINETDVIFKAEYDDGDIYQAYYKAKKNGDGTIDWLKGNHIDWKLLYTPSYNDRITKLEMQALSDYAYEDNVTYILKGDNTLYVSGIGEVHEKYRGNSLIEEVTIDVGITGIIGSKSFMTCESLRKLTINDCSIISEYAFAECSNLVTVYIPNSVNEIKAYAFGNNDTITSTHADINITYEGTTDQWNNSITKDANWNTNSRTIKVKCSDGTITI